MKKYYLDSCIWRDFYENRFSKSGKPFGKYANGLFKKILNNNDRILFSEIIIKELLVRYTREEINIMLKFLFLGELLIKIKITKEEHLEAIELSKKINAPYGDCVIAIQARNNGAIIVTQDKHFFEDLKNIARAKKPQDII